MPDFVGGWYEDVHDSHQEPQHKERTPMTGVTMAPDEARQKVQAAIEDLRDAIRAFLTERGGSSALSELVQDLRSRGQADEIVSRALAGMLSNDQLGLTSDRRVVLKDVSQ
jgi:hypothetical protein